jgi:anti-anti-sigma factor
VLAVTPPLLDVIVVCDRAAWRVIVAGELDLASGGELAHVAESVASAGPEHVDIDLSRVTFVDMAGWRAVQAARQQIEAVGGTSRISATSSAVDRALGRYLSATAR